MNEPYPSPPKFFNYLKPPLVWGFGEWQPNYRWVKSRRHRQLLILEWMTNSICMYINYIIWWLFMRLLLIKLVLISWGLRGGENDLILIKIWNLIDIYRSWDHDRSREIFGGKVDLVGCNNCEVQGLRYSLRF